MPTNILPPVPSVAGTAPEALPLPNAVTTTPQLASMSGARVNVLGNAISNTATGLWPVLGSVAMLGLTWLGLKTIILGKNPLKS